MSINEVRYLPECGSTNAYAKEHFEEFGPVGAVYTTNQTAGRGRLGRSWVNAEGKALYYTAAIREPLAQPATLPLLASLAVRTQLKLRYGVDCQIKWPNDLLLNGKKIVGILCEGVSYGYQQQGRGILCGIGINLAQPQSYFDAAGLPNGTSLALQGAKVDLSTDPAWLAEGLTDFGFDRNMYVFARDGFAPFREEYKAACVNIGRRVTFDLPGGRQGAGEAIDVDEEGRLVVRTDSGEMAPLSQFVNLTRVYSSEVLNRFNLYNSIAVNGTAASGYSSGDAIQAIREVAAEVLPKGYGFEFDGITREEAQTGSNTAIIFGICILLIYLILSALYESFFVPFAVILAVPCGLTGSFLMAKAMGLENNIYLQTGIIMLIGLLSKTAILITEYAADRRAGGMSLTQAAVSAAKARLRPILMTVLTCVFGMIPLMLSHGVGANGNSTLGSGVVGGMIVGTLALLFLVPTLFIVFQTLQEKIKPVEFTSPDWCIQAEIEENQKEPIDEEAKTDDDTK